MAIPYIIQEQNQHKVHYFYFGLDERVTAFDVSHIVQNGQGFELHSPAGEFRMYLSNRQDLDGFFLRETKPTTP